MSILHQNLNEPVCIGCNNPIGKKSVTGFCSETCKSYCNSVLNSVKAPVKAMRGSISPKLALSLSRTKSAMSAVDTIRAGTALKKQLSELKQTLSK